MEKTLTTEFFKIFSIWTFEKGRQQCSFHCRRCKRMRELELYLEEQQDRSSDLMDDLSDKSAKDSSLFSLA